MNLRKKCALDCCTITNLNEFNHKSLIAYWIVECFSTQKMWVRVQWHLSIFSFYLFFFRFASFFVFILDFVHNWIHVFEFGMRICKNTAP